MDIFFSAHLYKRVWVFAQMAMKWIKIVLPLFILTGCKHEPAYRIYGKMSDLSCDSTKIYLVPAVGPQTRERVDSAYIQKGTFHFEGDEERICILRLGFKRRMDHQELLIVTEPGEIHAFIGEVSSASGTPQNNRLQQWKEYRERLMAEVRGYLDRWRESHTPADSLRYRQVYDSLQKAQKEYTYAFLKEEGNTTLGRFFYRNHRGSFTEEQWLALDSIICND